MSTKGDIWDINKLCHRNYIKGCHFVGNGRKKAQFINLSK